MTDHFKKTASAVMVVFVDLEMLGELVDTGSKNSYLYLGRTGVALMSFVSGDYFLLFFLGHFIFTFHNNIPYTEPSAGDRLPENQAYGKKTHTGNVLYTKNPRL